MDDDETKTRIQAALLLLYPIACGEGPFRNDVADSVLYLERIVHPMADAREAAQNADVVRELAVAKGAM